MNRIGIIGLGGQATSHHLPSLQTCKDGKLVAICDRDRDRALSFARRLDVEAYADPEEMLGNADLDMLILAVPHDQYAPLLHLAAEARVNVLKDKPYARSLREGREVAERFTRAGRCVTTHVQRRLAPHYALAKQLVPAIGEVFWAELRYTLFVREPHVGWRGSRRRAGGGCIIDMGYHMIDLILWYLGLPRLVHALTGCRAVPGASYDAEDSAHILYSFGEQGVGTCLLSRRSPPKSELIRLMGTGGILEITPQGLEHRSPGGETIGSYPAGAPLNHVDAACALFQDPVRYAEITTSHLEHLAVVEACYASAELDKGVDPREFL